MVNEALSDYPRLLRKTRTIWGKVKSEVDDDKEEDIGIFDDTDFYQQLLRDVIESRGDGVSGMDDWIALQQEKKAKKKVDTKASKGRKLRYVLLMSFFDAYQNGTYLFTFIAMRPLKSFRTSWSPSPLLVLGTRSRLMSSSRHC